MNVGIKKPGLEAGIRWKVTFIGIAMAVICAFMIAYIYQRLDHIDRQRERIEENHRLLVLAGELGRTVNEAQSEANLYLANRRVAHLRLFREKAADVEQIIDTLAGIAGADFEKDLLIEMGELLREKGRIVTELNRQFTTRPSVDTLTSELRRVAALALFPDTVFVTNTVKDTVVNPSPTPRNLLQRLGRLFYPERDTLITVTTQVTDTLSIIPSDRVEAFMHMEEIVDQVSVEYTARIREIQNQVNNLILTDHRISARISELSNIFSSHVTEVSLLSIRDNENSMKRNAVYSVAGGIFILLFVILVILTIIKDVNKGYQARKALTEANQRIQGVMDTRHRLLLSVSHDIKSPLGLIMGRVDLWKERNAVKDGEALQVRKAGEYIFSLLQNLLDFSALEQGKIVLSSQRFRLRGMLEETAGLFEDSIAKKGLDLSVDIEIEKETQVIGDEIKIKQVLANLISNAVKYTSEGKVTLGAVYEENTLRFTVSDTGSGIPRDQMEQLFVPFARLERQKDMAPGSGFGLYVVKGLTDLLGGSIDIRSEVDRGTVVDVVIPLQQTRETATREAMRVLVTDDDDGLLSVARDMLERLGYHVEICGPQESLSVGFENYSIVITDMEMGKVTGLDILRAVRAKGGPTKVVVMTGRADYGSSEARKDGFDGYIPKPVTLSSLERLQDGFSGPHTTGAETSSSSLFEMLDGDREAIAEITAVFADTTSENLRLLHSCIQRDDFAGARALCHKMWPMFRQMGAGDWSDILLKMDAHRGGAPLKFWRGKLTDFIGRAEKFIESLQKQYTEN